MSPTNPRDQVWPISEVTGANGEALSQETLERLKQAVGPSGWSTEPDTLDTHTIEWLRKFRGSAIVAEAGVYA